MGVVRASVPLARTRSVVRCRLSFVLHQNDRIEIRIVRLVILTKI